MGLLWSPVGFRVRQWAFMGLSRGSKMGVHGPPVISRGL